MTLFELFRRLSFGELSNLAIGTEGSGAIAEKDRPRLAAFANEGLTRLYSRFTLKEKAVLLETVEGITNYHLKRRFSEATGSQERYLYIKDLAADPFEEDVLRILAVVGDDGRQRVLNDVGDPSSLFTPQHDTLQVPRPRPGEFLSVVYQARHPQIQGDGREILSQEIDLPVFLEPALQAFVASKVFGNMNGQESTAKGAEYANVFEAICRECEVKDLAANTWATTHFKLHDRGFV